MGMGGRKSRYRQRIEITTNTLIRRLTYEETLQVLTSEGSDVNSVINDAVGFGQQVGLRESIGGGSLGKEINKAGGGFIGGFVGGAKAGAKAGAFLGPAGAVAGSLIGSIIGSIGGTLGLGSAKRRVAVDYEESGWEMQRKWLETMWDIASYRIGISDVGFFSYAFEQSGEAVSHEFLSPLPIRKISLTVDQNIPRAFTDFDPTFPWIEYFVSVDGGETFIPIAPEEATVLRGTDNESIKQFINVNSGIAAEDRDPREEYVDTASPVRSVRFKFIMNRPTSIPDADNYTPILRNYRMKLFPDKTENSQGLEDLRSKPAQVDTRVNS